MNSSRENTILAIQLVSLPIGKLLLLKFKYISCILYI